LSRIDGAVLAAPAYSPSDVAATIYRAIGIDGEPMLHDRQNRPLPVLPQGEAIAGVMG
jgi:hypothetical protein